MWLAVEECIREMHGAVVVIIVVQAEPNHGGGGDGVTEVVLVFQE